MLTWSDFRDAGKTGHFRKVGLVARKVPILQFDTIMTFIGLFSVITLKIDSPNTRKHVAVPHALEMVQKHMTMIMA